MQTTVFRFAEQYNLVSIIERAASFHPNKIHLGVVWNIPVEFNPRLMTTAGLCHYSPAFRIELNSSLGLESERVALIDTFLHELAHAHAFMTHGPEARGHGWQWHEAMWQLGQTPQRLHRIAACRKATTKAVLDLDDMGL